MQRKRLVRVIWAVANITGLVKEVSPDVSPRIEDVHCEQCSRGLFLNLSWTGQPDVLLQAGHLPKSHDQVSSSRSVFYKPNDHG